MYRTFQSLKPNKSIQIVDVTGRFTTPLVRLKQTPIDEIDEVDSIQSLDDNYSDVHLGSMGSCGVNVSGDVRDVRGCDTRIPHVNIQDAVPNSSCGLGSKPNSRGKHTNTSIPKGSCGIGGSCGDGNLLPLMDPLFNMREAAKHIILLEDHLFHTNRRCIDCITKHMYTIEGFLDESSSLDNESKYQDVIEEVSLSFKDICKQIRRELVSNSNRLCSIAQKLRQIRKTLMYLTKDFEC